MALAASMIMMQATSAYGQAQAARSQGKFQQSIAESNARTADLQAEDALRRGRNDVENQNLKTKGLIGSQRAALAAQGIDVASGSALDVQEDTAGRGALDALTIKNNAFREAWGYRTQAQELRSQGQLARLAARNEARSTLLTGGLGAVQSGVGGYDRYQKNKGTKQQFI